MAFASNTGATFSLKILAPVDTRLFKRKEKIVADFDVAEKNCRDFLNKWESENLIDPSLRKNFLDINRESMANWHTMRKQKLETLRQALHTKLKDAEERKVNIDDEERFKFKMSNIKWELIKYKV